jgi:hypothetical protein
LDVPAEKSPVTMSRNGSDISAGAPLTSVLYLRVNLDLGISSCTAIVFSWLKLICRKKPQILQMILGLSLF